MAKLANEYWEVELCEDHDGGSVWLVDVECLGTLEQAREAKAAEVALGHAPPDYYRIVHVVRTVVE